MMPFVLSACDSCKFLCVLFMCVWALMKLFVSFLPGKIKPPGTFRNTTKPLVPQNKMSLHLHICPSIILPIVQRLWLSRSSLLLSLSPARFAFSFSSEHKHWNMKVFIAIFLDLYSPHPKQKRKEEKNRKCSQWGLEPKLKEWCGAWGVQNHKQTKQKKK